MRTRLPWLLAVAGAAFCIVWVALLLAIPRDRSVVFLPRATTGLEIPIACLWLVAGLVLLAFPEDLARRRLHWVAVGFLVLAFGGLLLVYVLPLLMDAASFTALLYAAWLTQTAAGTLMAVGLWPEAPPPYPRRARAATLAAFTGVLVLVVRFGNWLPALAHVKTLAEAEQRSPMPLRDLTGWHWALAIVPLAAIGVAALGSARHYPGRLLGGWLLLGTVLYAGALLHDTFWPAAFGPIVTPASRVRLAIAAFVTVGAMLEMQRVAVERAVLLAGERAATARMAELNHLRDDFTAMVAHELGGPLGAVRRAAELATADPLTSTQARALATIAREVELLDALVADVQLSAAVERDEFTIHPRPVAVAALLDDAARFARTLPGDHAFTFPECAAGWVMADPARVAQVLRNLLGNAAKYSPPNGPIAVRVTDAGPRLQIAISDRGPGIGEDDLPRIFEKYGRGRRPGRRVPGAGLGLYLSRQIARAHGGDLQVSSVRGEGTTFWFDLELVP